MATVTTGTVHSHATVARDRRMTALVERRLRFDFLMAGMEDTSGLRSSGKKQSSSSSLHFIRKTADTPTGGIGSLTVFREYSTLREQRPVSELASCGSFAAGAAFA